jgi:hypothetical protein
VRSSKAATRTPNILSVTQVGYKEPASCRISCGRGDASEFAFSLIQSRNIGEAISTKCATAIRTRRTPAGIFVERDGRKRPITHRLLSRSAFQLEIRPPHGQLPRLKSLGFPRAPVRAGADHTCVFFRSTKPWRCPRHISWYQCAAARGSKRISARSSSPDYRRDEELVVGRPGRCERVLGGVGLI